MPQGSVAAMNDFLTPRKLAQMRAEEMESERGRLLIASCCSGTRLAREVVARYRELSNGEQVTSDILFIENIDRRFSDGETCVRLDIHVGGADVFLFQSLLDPTSDLTVDQNYIAFLIAARAFRENGAQHITGVLPYLAYARQDKPTKFTREATTARLMADLAITAGITRQIVWDPHCGQIRGFYGPIPVTTLESLTLFIHEFERFKGRDDVIVVAPDAGASKFVTHFGRALDLKCAIAAKHRPKPEEVEISEIIGDFAGKRVAIVLDDMISGGGTTAALVRKLITEKGIEEVYLGASHNLCIGRAYERLTELHRDCGLKEVIVTDSIPQTNLFRNLPFLKIRSLSDQLARTINRVHYGYSVSEVFYQP